jgi:rSAM/selenodomain-associated transferase 1
MKKAIIIMAKVPEAGKVKTRLQPFLSAEQCAAFAKCLLRDAIEKAASLQNQLIIAYSPIERRAFFDEFSQHKIILVPQTGVDLGEKMFNAFNFAFEQKIDSAVMIGTDSPTFPRKFIEKAFEFLEKTDAVLGESEDGGYYLIGLKKLKKEIFEGVTWSSPETFEQTARNLENCGLKLSLLPKWFDVDLPGDLERLTKELLINPNPAPFTAKWLNENIS